jgi:hypothetical protein
MADQDDDQQTSDDQSGTQATESDPQTSQDQVTGQSAAQTTDDQVRANRTPAMGTSKERTVISRK